MDIINNIVNLVLNNPIVNKYLNYFLNYWQVFNWHKIFLVYKITAVVVSLGFIVAIIYFLAKSSFIKLMIWQDIAEIFSFRQYGLKKIEKRWQEFLKRLERASEAEQKLVVIEAENVLDETLVGMGISGMSFGERIKQLKREQLPSFDEVLKAHEIRNNIVHDPDYRLTLDQTRKTLEIYEKALRELGMFD